MTDQTPVQQPTPAGWYADPSGAPQSRWWDGTQWTQQVSTPYQHQQQPARAPEGTPTSTPWIWLIALLPILPLLALLLIDWRSMFDFSLDDPNASINAQFAVMSSLAYILALVGGWAVYGLCAFFAYRDWRELAKRGVPRPFHWAFVFLGSLVYVIGRSVVVRNRTGSGAAGPILAAVAYLVVTFIIIGIMMASMITAILEAVPTMRS